MSLGDEPGYPDTGHTRTRLPDDPYGGASRRGGRSSSRSLVTVVGVVVLLIAAIAFANRGDGNDSSTSSTTANGGGANGSQPKTSSTAATGTKPVETKSGGIPTGFAHSAQGAQSAAANYSVVLGSTDMFVTAKRHAIVSTIYTPDSAASKQSGLDSAYSSEKFLTNIGLNKNGTAPTGQAFISRVIPVGTKVTSASTNAATVAVWYTSLFGLSGASSTNPVTESWYTTTYQLTWVDSDWKIVDFQQKDGPVPVGRDQQSSTADDMTKAVEEFGGFTYAR
ncbi:hypothetical protein [Streptomyces sasae]|uniref:hypothetical protein n=1 Tax=Streptomyces sasae TaxID=1266772 RepID=UPI00292E274D|nr:hypothetical protein [Streptomyces sasae]